MSNKAKVMRVHVVQLNPAVDLCQGALFLAGNAINVILALLNVVKTGPKLSVHYYGWVGSDFYHKFKTAIANAGATSHLFFIRGTTRINRYEMAGRTETGKKGVNGYRVGPRHLNKLKRRLKVKRGEIVLITGSQPSWAAGGERWIERTRKFLIELITHVQDMGGEVWLDVPPELLEVVFRSHVRPALVKSNRLETAKLAQIAGVLPSDLPLAVVARMVDEAVVRSVAEKLMSEGTLVASFSKFLYARFADCEEFLCELKLPGWCKHISDVGKGDRTMAMLLAGRIILWGREETLRQAKAARISGMSTAHPAHFPKTLHRALMDEVRVTKRAA